MAIDVIIVAVLLYAHIMYIYPGRPAVLVQDVNDMVYHLHIGFIHQAGYRAAQQLVAFAQDEDAHGYRHYRIQPGPAGVVNNNKSGHQSQAAVHIRHNMLPVAGNGNGRQLTPFPYQVLTQQQVYQRSGANKPDTTGNILQLIGTYKVLYCFKKDQASGNKDHGPLRPYGEKLHFAMPVGMVGIPRFAGEVNTVTGKSAGYDIDDGFQRIRQDSNGMREKVRRKLSHR